MADEHDSMEDWILVQPCRDCGMKTLRICEYADTPHYKPLRWGYVCGNDDCRAGGRFGYDNRSVTKEIIFHPLPRIEGLCTFSPRSK